ncbi:MAG: thymidylate synthase [Methylococcales bacterium]
MVDIENKDFISESSIDDLMRNAIERLLREVDAITASKGEFTEIFGVLLELTNPRARISRTDSRGIIFSCLGEFLWYMSASNELSHIQYYLPSYNKFSDNGMTLQGGYGPRLFAQLHNNQEQLHNIINLLKNKRTSRQAVIQLFDKEDLSSKSKDIPCTCTLQFLIRHGRLHMLTNMRSNDVFIGLPHDIFAFTMIQELVARSLGTELGTYKHVIGSLHLYSKDRKKAQMFLDEGWTSNISMPIMPKFSPWESISTILDAESKIRKGFTINLSELNIDEYWIDIVKLLLVLKMYKSGDISGIQKIIKLMPTDAYTPFINKKYEQLLASQPQA